MKTEPAKLPPFRKEYIRYDEKGSARWYYHYWLEIDEILFEGRSLDDLVTAINHHKPPVTGAPYVADVSPDA